jgi:hypothetical protein
LSPVESKPHVESMDRAVRFVKAWALVCIEKGRNVGIFKSVAETATIHGRIDCVRRCSRIAAIEKIN